jgi:ABC-type uncharacterized transport system permease subunit
MSHCPHIMVNPALNFLAPALYLATAVLIAQRLASGHAAPVAAKIGSLSLTLGAIVLHAAILYTGLYAGGVNLSLTAAFSLVAWIVAVMYFTVSLFRPLDSLGILVMPLAGLTVLAAFSWPAQNVIALSSPWQAAHVVIALLAYSLLCLAAAQSLMLLLQERELKRKHLGGVIRALPPMELTEKLMFHLIGVGFLLLTATVISGVFFAEQFFGKPFSFTHHIVLAMSAWIVYAILLFGRWRLGWRGRTAIRWTLGGFLLLVLAYFGSKFVLEVLLGRH